MESNKPDVKVLTVSLEGWGPARPSARGGVALCAHSPTLSVSVGMGQS